MRHNLPNNIIKLSLSHIINYPSKVNLNFKSSGFSKRKLS